MTFICPLEYLKYFFIAFLTSLRITRVIDRENEIRHDNRISLRRQKHQSKLFPQIFSINFFPLCDIKLKALMRHFFGSLKVSYRQLISTNPSIQSNYRTEPHLVCLVLEPKSLIREQGHCIGLLESLQAVKIMSLLKTKFACFVPTCQPDQRGRKVSHD